MPIDLNATAAIDLALQAERFYAALIQAAGSDAEPNLGGKLLYAGELDQEGRALDRRRQYRRRGIADRNRRTRPRKNRQSEDGIIDFLVTSLDEALRILKNEIRKRETVAVCVAAAPEAVEREMLERGVLPDLLRPGSAAVPEYAAFLSQGAQQIQLSDLTEKIKLCSPGA
jgi:urocanate hydratase